MSMQLQLEKNHTKNCRVILGISMWELSIYTVRNIYILARVGIPSMENIHRKKYVCRLGTYPAVSLKSK